MAEIGRDPASHALEGGGGGMKDEYKPSFTNRKREGNEGPDD